MDRNDKDKRMEDLLKRSGFKDKESLEEFIEAKHDRASSKYLEMFDAGFFETFGALVSEEETLMDAYCYFIVSEQAQARNIVEIPYMPGLVPEHVKHELKDTDLQATTLMMSSIQLRSMMLSSMMYGVWWQQEINKLNELWDKGE